MDRTLPPPLGPTPPFAAAEVCVERLANGVEWLHAERHDLPLIDIQVVIRGGVEQDAPAHAGLTALTAETMEEGTVTRTGHEIADAIDRLGATLAIRASWDATTIALHALAPRMESALALLADVLCNATFPEAEVRRRRDERLASLLQERDEPAALAARALAEAIYGRSHPYGRSPRGTRATVESLDRERLGRTHQARFRPTNTFITSVGAVSHGGMQRVLEAAFEGWGGEGETPAPAGVPPGPGERAIRLVHRPGAPQSEMRVGCPGPPRVAPDHAALVVMNTLLGGAFTSRLNLKLREEKGFTYGARSSFALRRHGGPFLAGAAVATRDTAEAVRDTLTEIGRMAGERVPADELERARSYVVLGLPRRLETGTAMAAQLAELHLHGLPPAELADFTDRVRAVTAADVRDAAARHVPADRLDIVVVGDAGVIRAPLEALGLGPVHDVIIET